MSTSSNDALGTLRRHFSEVSSDDFIQKVHRYSPSILKFSDQALPGEEQNDMTGQIVLFRSRPSPLPLKAYLASALTGLDEEERNTVFGLSKVISEVCAFHEIELYEPRTATDPLKHPTVSASSVFKTDRERVLGSDLLIHLCHFPSTGAGEELGFAYSAVIPIVLVARRDTQVSRMVSGIPSLKVELRYEDEKDLERQLNDCLFQLRPLLEQRKMAFSKYDANVIGNKIRMLREELGLTRADVADSIPELTVDHLQLIEESVDRMSDPSLMLLRRIATILKTTVADLVEPDLGQTLVAFLESWASGRMAARFPMSERDRNRIIRRILRRMIESFDKD